MTSWYEFLEGKKPMGDVVDFKPTSRRVEHVDSSTIVEKLELTPELKAEFEAMGYTFDEENDCENRTNES